MRMFDVLREDSCKDCGSYPRGKPSSPPPPWLRHWLRLGLSCGVRYSLTPVKAGFAEPLNFYHLPPP